MSNISSAENQILYVADFNDLVAIPFEKNITAICRQRTLPGDFAAIVEKGATAENITVLDEAGLNALELSEAGQLARTILLNDYALLKAQGALPTLNIIRHYDRDDEDAVFPTDVYSFHADSAPIPTSTFLCTYHGAPSELLPNAQAVQKILVPGIRDELKKLYHGEPGGFDAFLTEHFFDLHYDALPGAQPISLGIGNMWRLATDHPQSNVLPCIHRAPKEKGGESRLLMIC